MPDGCGYPALRPGATASRRGRGPARIGTDAVDGMLQRHGTAEPRWQPRHPGSGPGGRCVLDALVGGGRGLPQRCSVCARAMSARSWTRHDPARAVADGRDGGGDVEARPSRALGLIFVMRSPRWSRARSCTSSSGSQAGPGRGCPRHVRRRIPIKALGPWFQLVITPASVWPIIASSDESTMAPTGRAPYPPAAASRSRFRPDCADPRYQLARAKGLMR
jgi:hypothetical protein